MSFRRITLVWLGLCLGCDKENLGKLVEFSDCPAVSGGPVSVQAAKEKEVADGSAIVTVRAQVEPATVAGKRDVSISTSNGTFVGAATPTTFLGTATFCGQATALLRSPRIPGLGILSLSFANAAAFDTVSFVRAWPDSLLVLAGSSSLRAVGDTTVFTIRLFRKLGLPSPGTIVKLLALGSDGQPIGVIRPNVLVLDTLGTAIFVAGDTLRLGVVSIVATIDTVGGQISNGTTLVVVK